LNRRTVRTTHLRPRIISNRSILNIKVDPGIIGGLVVKLGSRMIDTSLRTKLNALKHAMKEVG
jgi:F0F1-type ATP synthase delta subunit